MPTRNIKRTYIGGTTSEARKKYFNLDKELTQVVTNLATSYGISPALVIDRLAHEGIIDRLIIDHNAHVQRGGEERPSRAFSTNTYNSPYGLFGLDNIFDTYTKGITKTKRPINIKKYTTTNESGERVNTGDTNNIYDTLELFTAELASRRNQVKQQYPSLTDIELDSATAARYNTTNRYFKQLMNSGEYKTKYPIDIEGINIPSPTKTDSKYIQSQSKELNLDRTFRNIPYNTYIYDNKSWNPDLFLEDGKVVNPNNKIVKGILKRYVKHNFSEPEQVNFVQEYKCGGRRKAQLGLDIREGGIAIPIANNMWYIHGRKHEDGGVTMGPNNKNGVEVEGGEVVEMIDSNHPSVGRQFAAGGQSQTMRVFSSVPLLRGFSPAQLVMGGANPNKVFKAQEKFKDRNRINDDGTRYENGGEKIYTPSKFVQRQIQETGRITIGGAPTIGGLRTAKYVKGLATAKGYAKQANKIFTKVDNFVNNSLQGLINKHKITPNQADAYKKFYNEIVGVNGVNIPKTASFFLNNESKEMKAGGIYIKPSKRGTFTATATKHGMGVQEFANKVLANKEDYSPAMVKKANFARNASRWKKEYGGNMIYTINGNVRNGLMSARPKAQYGKQTIIRNNKEWEYDEKSGAYVPVKNVTKYKTIAGKTYKKEPDSKNYVEVTDSIEKIKVNQPKKQIVKENKNSINKLIPINENKYTSVTKPNTGESYVINPLTGEWIRNGVIETSEPSVKGTTKVTSKSSSTPRGRGTKASTSKAASQSTPSIQDTVNKITMDAWKASKTPKIDLSKVEMPSYNVSDLGSKETKAAKAKLNSPTTGDVKEAPWVPQYNLINTRDWIGVGTNLAGHIASYFANNSLLKKAPMPTKPVQFQAAKLRTTHNINPDLANINEVTQMNLAEVGRNTASSNTSIARKQRIMNEARDARNKLYGQKENIETQLINLDRRNRQDVYNRNIAAYNDWLDKTYVAKSNNLVEKQRNLNNLISGIPMAVNTMLETIESRKSTNDMIQAMSASRPNVDGRLLGIGDYYSQKLPDGRTAIYNKNHKLVKYV